MTKKSAPIRILLLEDISPTARAVFDEENLSEVTEKKEAFAGADLSKMLKGVHILGIRSTTYLTKDILDQAPDLMAVGCFCIGTNQVDLQAAGELGVPVFNAPFSNTRSVAELAVAAIIALSRRLPEHLASMRRGVWNKSAKGAHEVRGKTIGIIGYGNIGAQLSVLAEHMGMRVIFYDIEKKLAVGNARQVGTLKELFETSDAISVHVPENTSTRKLIGAPEFALMKKGAMFINYSRGSVVDIDALAEVLKSGHLSGAAIDVYPSEPKSRKEAFESPLLAHDNVLLTPHVGGSTEEAQRMIGTEVAEKLARYVKNGSTTGAVNMPQVSLPPHDKAHRILNIHRNVPGILKQVNTIVAEAGGNIVGQFLQTNSYIGYLVLDVESIKDPEKLLEKIQKIEGSMRTRVLY